MNINLPQCWRPVTGALLLAAGLAIAVPMMNVRMQALLLPSMRQQTVVPQWKVIQPPELASGATIPANTNTVLIVESSINRTILFGPRSATIRYWGYCLAEGATVLSKPGALPGKVFLSEAEREWREKRQLMTAPRGSSSSARQVRIIEPIRHQTEKLLGVCYVMTTRALPAGTDGDADGLNTQVEKQYRTDPRKPDTDGDGVKDGDEIIIGSNPILRDTDSDGLIDGIENKNRDSRKDADETDSTLRDSDGDSMCDGACRVTGDVRLCRDMKGQDCFDLPYARWVREDRNLNGMVDRGGYDPRTPDTDGDDILDSQEYLDCILKGNEDDHC